MEELQEYPIEPLDTDSIFAKFTRKALSDSEIMVLSMASMVCNPNVPASEIYLTYVSRCDCYVADIREFCLGVAYQLSQSRRPTAKGTYPYMPSYNQEWGKHAVSDAMVLAFLGRENIPALEGHNGRCCMLGVDPKTYRKVRDFIAGMLKLAVKDYREALEWAMGKRRDTVLQAKWGRRTGQSFPPYRTHAIMTGEEGDINPLPSGCYVKTWFDSIDGPDNVPESLNPGFRHDELWRP